MDTKTLKIELTRLILETEITDLLKRIFKDIKKEKDDFWLELSEDQKAEVELSRRQVKNGETEDWDSFYDRHKDLIGTAEGSRGLSVNPDYLKGYGG